jgi:hypothetical protein
MTKHSFEIRQRQSGEHRGPSDGRLGHVEMVIDGIGTEYTNDPMQAFERCLKQAIGEGKLPGGEAEKRAIELCEARSIYCLNRVINHIREGSMIPGGVPLATGGGLDLAPIKKPPRTDEHNAAVGFLNRGKLKGLDKDDRKKREQHRNERRDHSAEWRERRLALIQAREKELTELVAELHANPGKAGKLDRQIMALREELQALQTPVLAASHGFQYAYGQYLTKQVQLVTDDIRIVPCMTNTTVDTERDAKDAVSDFTTLDEFDGSGYSTGGQALDNQAVNIDDANDRAEFDADDEAATLGAGTRSIQGNLLISFITNLNSSLPLHWIEYASNKTPDGSLFTVVFNAEGILQAADG